MSFMSEMKAKHECGFTLVELLVSLVVIGILASLLLPALAKSKVRAKRQKCAGNIKQISSAFQGFAVDNDGRYPWLLFYRDILSQSVELGKPPVPGDEAWVDETRTLFAQSAIKSSLVTARILVSPLDPDRSQLNESIDMATVDMHAGGVDDNGTSYGIVNGGTLDIPPSIAAKDKLPHLGADEARPNSILIMTRNISGPDDPPGAGPAPNRGEDRLSNWDNNHQEHRRRLPADWRYAYWKGSDKHPVDPRSMALLDANFGQVGLADGSGLLFNDADLLQQVVKHHDSLAGTYKGCPSGVLDTPN